MKYLLTFFCMALLICSCAKKDQSEEARVIYNESMKIHDEIMPRMDELFRLKQELTHQVDSLSKDSAAQAASIGERRAAIDKLTMADKSMMDWMHGIKEMPSGDAGSGHHHDGHHGATMENLSDEEMLKVQKQQKEDIERIKKNMEESIAAAKHLLN